MSQDYMNQSQIKQQTQHLNPEQRQKRQDNIMKLRQDIQVIKRKLKKSVHYRKFLKHSKDETQKEMKQLIMDFKNAQQKIKDSDKSLLNLLQDLQNQQNKISQQKQQLESDYQKIYSELEKKYLLNRTFQELKDYHSLFFANFKELIYLIFKEDFDPIMEGSQHFDQEAIQQDDFALLEQLLSNNRKKVIKAIILWHLFSFRQQQKNLKNINDRISIEDKKKIHIKKLNELHQIHQDNIKQQNKKERAQKELNENRMELELQCTHLRNLIALRKAKQQMLIAKTQLDTLIKNKQQVNQKILSITQQIKSSYDDTVEEVHNNIQDDSQDFQTNISDIEKKLNEWKQLMCDKLSLIKNQNQILNKIKEDKSDQQISQLMCIIEKHTPQIRKLSEQEVLKCLGEKMQKIDSIDNDNKKIQNCLDCIKKGIGENINSQKEHQIKIQDFDKEIKSIEIKINTDRQNIILLDVKFGELKQKIIQNPKESTQNIGAYIADLELLLNQIQEVYDNNMDDRIRKEYQDFVFQTQTSAANKPEKTNYSNLKKDREHYQAKYNEQLIELQTQEKDIQYEVNKIKESEQRKIIQIQQITNQARKLKKSIIRLKSKYRVFKIKFDNQWRLFYKHERQKLEYEQKIKLGKIG